MTIGQAQFQYCATLQKSGVYSALLDVDVLLCHVLKQPMEYIFAHPEAEISKGQIQRLGELTKRRSQHVPVAYLTGTKEFFGYEFKVNRSVLIPRAETELVVESALDIITAQPQKKWRVIDVGTGSGAIIVALAKKLLEKRLPVGKYQFQATEISSKAMAVAKTNATRLCVAQYIRLTKTDLLKNIRGKFDIIIANLPYLPRAEYKNSPYLKILRWEPKLALTDGQDGLAIFRKFLAQSPQRAGKGAYLIFEIGSNQARPVTSLIKKTYSAASVTIKKDLCGLDRIIKAKI